MSLRTERVESLIRREVSEIISQEVEAPEGLLITVTEVRVSPDVRHATVLVTTLKAEDEGRLMEFLRERIGEIQRILNKRLVMKFVPKLYFKFDETGMKSERINELLKKIAEEREAKEQEQGEGEQGDGGNRRNENERGEDERE